MLQAGNTGDGFPFSLRNMTDQPLAARAAAPDRTMFVVITISSRIPASSYQESLADESGPGALALRFFR
jgi:hypothetical protein